MKQYQILLLPIFLLILSSCSALNEYYINNYTEAEILVTLAYSDEVMLPNDMPEITYGPLLESIKGGSQQSFKDKLPYQGTDNGTVQFSIPAKSTAFLGLSGGGDKLYTRMQILAQSNQLIIEGQEHRDYFKIKDNLIGAIVNVLNVE